MNKVYKTFSVVFLISILVKVFDIVKTLLVSAFLGVSNDADVFLSVISIPDGLLILIGIDSLRGIINSEFSHYKSLEEEDKIWVSMKNIFYIVIIIGLLFGITIFFFREIILRILLPGFSEQKMQLAVVISAIIFPVFFFKGLIGLLQSVYNAFKRFYIPVVAPVLISIFIICSAFFPPFEDKFIYNFSISYLMGNIAVFFVILVIAFRFIKLLELKKFTVDSITKKVLKGSGTILILVIANQLFFYSKNFFASYFPEGAIASLAYAGSIPNVITTLTFTTVFSVLLSTLSSSFIENKRSYTKKIFLDTYLILFFLFIPILVVFLLEAREILSIVYLRGNFGESGIDTTLIPFYWEVAAILSWLTYVIPTAYFLSKQKYKAMTIIGVSVYTFGILLNFGLSKLFGYYGLSLSNFITMGIHGIFLFYFIRKYIGSLSEFITKISRVSAVGALTFVVIFIVKYILGKLFYFDSKPQLIIQIITITIFVVLVYIVFSSLFKVNYISSAKKLLTRN